MDSQEIFDRVVEHLWNQKVPALNENNTCVYRGPNGTMCAVGCLIPNELYDPEMDEGGGKAVDVLFEEFHEVTDKIGFTKENLDLLETLQYHHDTWDDKDINRLEFTKEFWEGLRNLALDHNLSTAKLDNLLNPSHIKWSV